MEILTRVDFFVLVQRSRVTKRFRTVLALVRFFAGVNIYVAGVARKTVGALELFAAQRTLEHLLLGVCPTDVRLQVNHVLKVFGTNVTLDLERLIGDLLHRFGHVYGDYMLLKFVYVEEMFLTNRTLFAVMEFHVLNDVGKG